MKYFLAIFFIATLIFSAIASQYTQSLVVEEENSTQIIIEEEKSFKIVFNLFQWNFKKEYKKEQKHQFCFFSTPYTSIYLDIIIPPPEIT